MRPFAVCLLGLALAVQGHASVRIMDASCPMLHPGGTGQLAPASHDHADHEVAGMEHHHDHGGHRPDPPDAPAAGHGAAHCIGHLGCQSLTSAIVQVQLVTAARQFVQRMPPAAVPAFDSYTDFLLWRPPARL